MRGGGKEPPGESVQDHPLCSCPAQSMVPVPRYVWRGRGAKLGQGVSAQTGKTLGAGLQFLLPIAARARHTLFMDSHLPHSSPSGSVVPAATVPAPRSLPITNRSPLINTLLCSVFGSRTPSCPSCWWCWGMMYEIRVGLIHTSCVHLAEQAVTKK